MTGTLVIAEAGVNHNGSVNTAKRLVDAAADAGADIVKFQSFNAELLAAPSTPKADYQTKHTDSKESQLDMLKSLELDPEAHHTLATHCKDRNIEFMSTPFDEQSVHMLVNEIGVKRLKAPSGEITNGPLLLKMAAADLPILVSTGMTTLEEIREALGVIAFGFLHSDHPPSPKAFAEALNIKGDQEALGKKITLLQCTTQYPTPYDEINLRAMDTLRDVFSLPAGLSDHSLGITVPIAAVARGATVIEKHLTLDCSQRGPDHASSLEPDVFTEMVQAIRNVEEALGSGEKKPADCERVNIAVARRSLIASRAIAKGETFTCKNLLIRRASGGLSPMRYWDLLGTEAKRDYRAEELVSE